MYRLVLTRIRLARYLWYIGHNWQRKRVWRRQPLLRRTRHMLCYWARRLPLSSPTCSMVTLFSQKMFRTRGCQYPSPLVGAWSLYPSKIDFAWSPRNRTGSDARLCSPDYLSWGRLMAVLTQKILENDGPPALSRDPMYAPQQKDDVQFLPL